MPATHSHTVVIVGGSTPNAKTAAAARKQAPEVPTNLIARFAGHDLIVGCWKAMLKGREWLAAPGAVNA